MQVIDRTNDPSADRKSEAEVENDIESQRRRAGTVDRSSVEEGQEEG